MRQTLRTASPSQGPSSPNSSRSPRTSAMENATASTIPNTARYQPAWRSWSGIRRTSSLLRHLGEVVHHGIELLGAQDLAVVGRHHAGGEALGDVGLRIHDVLADLLG